MKLSTILISAAVTSATGTVTSVIGGIWTTDHRWTETATALGTVAFFSFVAFVFAKVWED